MFSKNTRVIIIFVWNTIIDKPVALAGLASDGTADDISNTLDITNGKLIYAADTPDSGTNGGQSNGAAVALNYENHGLEPNTLTPKTNSKHEFSLILTGIICLFTFIFQKCTCDYHLYLSNNNRKNKS